jgi:hypothetical protein
MALKMRPTGLGSGFYKNDVDYNGLLLLLLLLRCH